MRRSALLTSLLATFLAACSGSRSSNNTPAPTPASITARAEMRDVEGRAVGILTLSQSPQGLLIAGDLTGLPAGVHGVHVHDVGRCDPPFTSAGGHFNPTQRSHGFRSASGYHAGDLAGVTTTSTGSVRFDRFTRDVTLGTGPTSLLDADGSSIVVHAGADDYATDPSGNSGGRIACGVVTR